MGGGGGRRGIAQGFDRSLWPGHLNYLAAAGPVGIFEFLFAPVTGREQSMKPMIGKSINQSIDAN